MPKKKGKRGKKKNEEPEEPDEEMATCPNCDKEIPAISTECPECGQEFAEEEDGEGQADEAEEAEEEPDVEQEEAEEEPDVEQEEDLSDETDAPPQKIKKTGLIIGVLLSFVGVLGVLGLRAGFIQPLFGISDPYPGIGTAEPMGHIVSIIPTILGLVVIMGWGIKNDPIYYAQEKAEEAEEEFIPISDDVLEEEFSEEIPGYEEYEDEYEDEPPEDAEESELDDLSVALDDITDVLDEGPTGAPEPVKNELAEQIRVERCEKMLKTAVLLPEDKKNLKELIASGISASDFTEELKKAIEKRKKREEEEDVSADEKASLLEDELVAELADLEDELEDDMDEDDLEDQILKEIEDLEDL